MARETHKRMTSTKTRINEILKGYVDCALWISADEYGDSLDGKYDRGDVAASSLRSMRADIVDFIRKNKATVEAYAQHRQYRKEDGSVWQHLGHDLWLTRSNYGAGFWDREYNGHDEIGEKLTRASKSLGTSYLYVGDDGKVYADAG